MSDIEVYSNLTKAEALDGSSIEDPDLRAIHQKMVQGNYLSVLAVKHLCYDGLVRQGQLVVHRQMHRRFQRIFASLLDLQYPIHEVRPIVAYGWSDHVSMAANNTSAYRPDFIVTPTRRVASEHTRGTAVDLNPLDNPLINANHTIEPAEAIDREPFAAAVILDNLPVIKLFSRHRMEYGGYWPVRGSRDYYGQILMDKHHFELRPRFVNDIQVPEGIWLPPQNQQQSD